MIKHVFSIGLIGVISCTSPENNAKLPLSPDESDSVLAGPTVDSQKGDAVVIEKELIDVPDNVKGVYTACSRPVLEDDGLRAIVKCGLFEKISSNPSQGISALWSYGGAKEVAVSILPLTADRPWAVQFTLDNANPELLAQTLDQPVFVANITDSSDNQFYLPAKADTQAYQWLAINGEALPESSFQGGSEVNNSVLLYVCRSYHSNGMIPGKLRTHFENPNKTICYSVFENETFESQSADGASVIYNTDLLLTKGEGYLSWVGFEGTMPANALQTGLDPNGENLYSCRSLERGPAPDGQPQNNPDGEATPGFLGANDVTCSHEYYGVNVEAVFEVLVWVGVCEQPVLVNPSDISPLELNSSQCMPSPVN